MIRDYENKYLYTIPVSGKPQQKTQHCPLTPVRTQIKPSELKQGQTKLAEAIKAPNSHFPSSPPIFKRCPNLLKLILVMRALSRNTQLKPSAQACSDAHDNLKPYKESK